MSDFGKWPGSRSRGGLCEPTGAASHPSVPPTGSKGSWDPPPNPTELAKALHRSWGHGEWWEGERVIPASLHAHLGF